MNLSVNHPVIRAYHGCGRLYERFGDFYVDHRHPRDLCQVAQRFVPLLVLSVGASCVLAFVVLCVGLASSGIDDWQQQSFQEIYYQHTTMAETVSWIGGALYVFGQFALICASIYVASAWGEEHSLAKRIACWVARVPLGAAIVLLVAASGLVIGLCYVLWLGGVSLFRLIRRAPKRHGPSMFAIIGHWLYGVAHGVCVPVEIVAES